MNREFCPSRRRGCGAQGGGPACRRAGGKGRRLLDLAEQAHRPLAAEPDPEIRRRSRRVALGPELNAEAGLAADHAAPGCVAGRRRSARDQPACFVAVEHHGRGLSVPEGAEPDKRGLSGGAHVRAVLVAVDDERGAEFRGERRERAATMRALRRSPEQFATASAHAPVRGDRGPAGIRDENAGLSTGLPDLKAP
jgi:hypothetical protein